MEQKVKRESGEEKTHLIEDSSVPISLGISKKEIIEYEKPRIFKKIVSVVFILIGIGSEIFAVLNYLLEAVIAIIFGAWSQKGVENCHLITIQRLTIAIGIAFCVIVLLEVGLVVLEVYKMISICKLGLRKHMKLVKLLILVLFIGAMLTNLVILVICIVEFVILKEGHCHKLKYYEFYNTYLIVTMAEIVLTFILSPCLCVCLVCTD